MMQDFTVAIMQSSDLPNVPSSNPVSLEFTSDCGYPKNVINLDVLSNWTL